MQLNKQTTNEIELWSKDFILFCISFFMQFFNIALFYLYPISLEKIGCKEHVIGFVMGIFSIAAVITRPYMGKLASIKGEKKIISYGLIISFIASIGYAFISSFGVYMLINRILHGIGLSAFLAGSFSIAAKTFPEKTRGEAFSILGAAIMGAVALGPAIGEMLMSKFGFTSIYYAAATATLLGLISSEIVSESITLNNKAETIPKFSSSLVFKKKSFMILLLSTIIFAHCQATVPTFLVLIANENGGNTGAYFFIAYGSSILIMLSMGKSIDKHGKIIFMQISYPILMLGILLIPITIRTNLFYISAILYGIGIGLLFPAHNAMAAEYGNQSEKPLVMAIFTSVYDTGFITGATISGLIAYQSSLDTTFYITGVFAVCGLIIVKFLK